MVAVLSGDGLGAYNHSLNLLGGSNNQVGRFGNQLFVNSVTGNLVVQQQDEYLASLGLDVGLIRTYNSLGKFDDDNGDNWRFNLHKRLKAITTTPNTVGSTVTKVYADGFEALFTYDASKGKYVSTDGSGAHDTITFSSNVTGDEWIFNAGTAGVDEYYHSDGRLIRSQDADGNTQTYFYTDTKSTALRDRTGSAFLLSRIDDSSGQSTTIEYTANTFNISQISTLSNTVTQTTVRYGYDVSNRLTEVIVDLSPADNLTADGKTWVSTYTYDGPSTRITSISNGNGEVVQFSYDSYERVIRVKDASGNFTEYNYDKDQHKLHTAGVNQHVLTDGSTSHSLDTSKTKSVETDTYRLDKTPLETATGIEYPLDEAGLSTTSTVDYSLDQQGLSTTKPGTVATDYHLDGRRLTDLPVVGSNELIPGEARSGLFGALGSTFYYTLEVPAGASALSILTSGGTGNLDVYVRHGAEPTTLDYDYVSNGIGNVESINVATPQAGVWHVMVVGTAAFEGASLQVDYKPDTTPKPLELIAGEARSGLSGALGSTFYYTIDVPTGASALSILTSGGTGDLDVYVKHGAKPTTLVYDYLSNGASNTENINVAAPQAGVWHVMVVGFTTFEGASIQADYTPDAATTKPATELIVGEARSGLFGALDGARYYTLDVPADATALNILTSGGTGNLDVYVRHGAQPTTLDYHYVSNGIGNAESINVATPQAGVWHVMVVGTAAFEGASLQADYTPDAATTKPSTHLNVGEARNGLFGALDGARYYTLEILPGTIELNILTSGGSGNLDVYVKHGAQPTTLDYDYVSNGIGNAESINVADPQTGVWHVMVVGTTAFEGASIQADYTPNAADTKPATELIAGEVRRGLFGALDDARYYTLEVPTGASALSILTGGGSGDLDVYVRRGAQPTKLDYQYISNSTINFERINVANPQAGVWHVMVVGNATFEGASIRADYTLDAGATRAYPVLNSLSSIRATGNINSRHFYKIEVPVGASNLYVNTTGSGDLGLHVRQGAEPDGTDWGYSSNYLNTANESVNIPNPVAGTWYVLLGAWDAAFDVALSASISTTDNQPTVFAGNDQQAVSGEKITINGLSQDYAGGSVVSYQWTQTHPVAGPTVTIDDPASSTLTFSAPIVQSLTALEFELTITDDSGLTATDRVAVFVKPGTSYYTVLPGDKWESIAMSLYGTADVVNELQAELGHPVLTAGARLYYLPTTLTDIQPITVSAPPHYVVQANDTWASIATALYGTASVADQLQLSMGSPSLAAGVILESLPATLSDIVSVAPYYQVKPGDSWSSIASLLYGNPVLGSELQTALGNPALTTDQTLTGLPISLIDKTATFEFYRVQSTDTWESIALSLYGSIEVADELRTAMGDTPLTTGKLLSGFPAELRNDRVTAPYYVIEQGDTWNTIAQSLYGTAVVADELQTSLGAPALVVGSKLTGFNPVLTNTVVAGYRVQAGDTWQTIAQALYGDARASDALRETFGNIELVADSLLAVPSTLTYSIPLTDTEITALLDNTRLSPSNESIYKLGETHIERTETIAYPLIAGSVNSPESNDYFLNGAAAELKHSAVVDYKLVSPLKTKVETPVYTESVLKQSALDTRTLAADELQNGVAKTGLFAGIGGKKYYTIKVPEGATQLRFSLGGGTGDANLYMKWGGQPGIYLGEYDYRSAFLNTNREIYVVDNPAAGDWHILVNAHADYSGAKLVADYSFGGVTAEAIPLVSGVAATNLSSQGADRFLYKIEVPEGATNLQVYTNGDNGGVSLYVKQGSAAYRLNFDASNFTPGTTYQELAFANPVAGEWYIALETQSDTHFFDNVSLYVRYDGVETQPSANAGESQEVNNAQQVYLNGAGHAMTGDYSYEWTQLSGPAVVLTNADRATPHFISPNVGSTTGLVFQLKVTDAAGHIAYDQVAITVEPAFYTVKLNTAGLTESWSDIASTLYGDVNLADELQDYLGNGNPPPVLGEGVELYNLSYSLTNTRYITETVAPYYEIQAGDSWESIATHLYEKSGLGDALRINQGNPDLIVGTRLSIKSTLSVEVAVAPYYTIGANDSWENIASKLYGTPLVADKLLEKMGTPAPLLTAGNTLKDLPDKLTYSTIVNTYYTVKAGDTWASIATALYSTDDVADELQANNAAASLAVGTRLRNLGTLPDTKAVLPYYLVQAGDTWGKIAEKLYGSADVATQLQTELGDPPPALIAGNTLTGLPAQLSHTVSLSLGQYAVQAGDTWVTIAQNQYHDARAAQALQQAMKNPDLVTGAVLTLPTQVSFLGSSNDSVAKATAVALSLSTSATKDYTLDESAVATKQTSAHGLISGSLLTSDTRDYPLVGVLSFKDGINYDLIAGQLANKTQQGSSTGHELIFANLEKRLPATNELVSGVAKTGLSGLIGQEQFYTIEVPPGTSMLRIDVGGGTGNADLYLRHGIKPQANTNQAEYHSRYTTNNELIVVENPAAGTWHLDMKAVAAFSGVSLKAEIIAGGIDAEAIPLTNGVGVPGISSGAADYHVYKINVPVGATNLVFDTAGGTGNSKMYVSQGAIPNKRVFQYEAITLGNADNISIANPVAGDWYVALQGYYAEDHFENLTLFARYDGVLTQSVANAGSDILAEAGQTIKLSGYGSGINGSYTYSWRQTGGPVVNLAGADSTTPWFTAPNLSNTEQLVFELKITDGQGQVSYDKVMVTVEPKFYTVQSTDTWSSIATSLYGTSAVADELEAALGYPPLIAGEVLYQLPASLLDTQTSQTVVNQFYTVKSGDTWHSIAVALYGTANVANELETLFGSSVLSAGAQLTGLPLRLTDGVETTPYYRVQTGDTWHSIAFKLYGSSDVADELQTAMTGQPLIAGKQLVGLPASQPDTFSRPGYYQIKSGDTWSSIALSLYGTVDVADALQVALGNPALVAGRDLSNIPSTLESIYSVAAYYTVQLGDTWQSIAARLYGSEKVAGALQTQLGNPVLAEGVVLTNLSVSLSNTETFTAKYVVEAGDSWASIATKVYGDSRAASALQTALRNPELTTSLVLDVPAEISYLVKTGAIPQSAAADATKLQTTDQIPYALTTGSTIVDSETTAYPIDSSQLVNTSYALQTGELAISDQSTRVLDSNRLSTTETQTTTTVHSLDTGTLTAPPGELVSGVTKTGLSANLDEKLYFTFEVPAGATKIRFQMAAGTGDADIYVKHGSAPTTSDTTYRPYLSGNEEFVEIANPAAGTWHVMLNAFEAFNWAQLQATHYFDQATNLMPGQTVAGLREFKRSPINYYKITVPSGATSLNIETKDGVGGSGDAHLYVKRGALPTETVYDYASTNKGNAETISIANSVDNPLGGVWYIGVDANAAYREISLTASYTGAAGSQVGADAGADQIAYQQEVVTLSGTAFNPDGPSASVQWTQLSGPAVTLSNASVLNPTFTAPDVAAYTALRFQLTVTDDSGNVSSDIVGISVKPALTGYYIVKNADSWASIASTLYGSSTVADELQALVSPDNPVLTAGQQLSGFALTLSDVVTTTTTVEPYYEVKGTDTWSTIAESLYGAKTAGNELQAAFGGRALASGEHLRGFPPSLNDSFATTPYYRVKAGDTWQSIAVTLYQSSDVADELQAALGNPVLTVGSDLTLSPGPWPDPLADTSIATSHYVIKLGDTWIDIATLLYGTGEVADELEAAMESPALIAGEKLSGFPASLDNTVAITPYYVIQENDTWNDVAFNLYGTIDVVDELQTALGSPLPPLTPGNHLTGMPTSINDIKTVAPFYVVQADDSWESIALLLYADAKAADALKISLGSPVLTPGVKLTVPPTLTYAFYAETGSQTLVTDASGNVTRLSHDAQKRLTQIQRQAGNGYLLSSEYQYDENDNLIAVTDSNGNQRFSEYDADGNLTKTRDSLGNIVKNTYDDNNLLDTQTRYLTPDPDGAGLLTESDPVTTRFVYDSNHHLRFVVSAEGRVTENRYDGSGQLTSTLVISVVYDVSTLTPADKLTESQLTGWLALQTDLSGSQRTNYAYDFRGLVQSQTRYASTDASGNGVLGAEVETQFIYDQYGRLIQSIDPRGVATVAGNDYATHFSYDGLGRLLSSTHYDANGVGTATSTTLYDDVNNRVTTTLANELATTSVYDKNGKLIESFNQNNSTRFYYDERQQRVMTEAADGTRTFNLYDTAGRLVGMINQAGTLTERIIDANGNLIKSIAYANTLNVSALVDLAGKPLPLDIDSLRPLADAEDRFAHVIYDQVSRPVYSVDAYGYVAQTFYDGAGRVTDTVAYSTAIDVSLLPENPGIADIHVVTSADDRHTRTFYDKDGNTLAVLDADGYLQENFYDAAGRLSHTVGYATQTAAAGRATADLVTLRPLASADDIHSYLFYNARNEVLATIDGEGYLTQLVYDDAGNVTQSTRYATRANPWTAGATLASLLPVPSASDRTVTNTYDSQNRLVTSTNHEGTKTTNRYDAVGNLISTSVEAGTPEVRTVTRRYDIEGRVIAELTPEGSALIAANPAATQAEIDAIWAAHGITTTYNKAGQLLRVTDQNGHKTRFYYDAAGRQVFTIGADGSVVENRFNSFNQTAQAVAYANRLSSTQLIGLPGGTVNSLVSNMISALASADDILTHVDYDLRGAVKRALDANGFATFNTYNAFGELTVTREQLSATAFVSNSFEYDRRGLVLFTREDTEGPGAINRTQQTGYDAFGRAIIQIDATGGQYLYQYDKLGQVIQVTDPLNNMIKTEYDAFGQVLKSYDANGNATTYVYNNTERSLTVTTAEGIQTKSIRNRLGEQVQVIDGNGNSTSYQYDRNGNLTLVTDAKGNQQRSDFDNANSLIETTNARGTLTRYEYDSQNRVITTTIDPTGLNLVSSVVYDAFGRLIRSTDSSGISTESQYDKRGQLTLQVVDPASNTNPNGANLTTKFTYDGRGNQVTVITAFETDDEQTVQYTYDKLSRRIQEILDPSGLAISTRYEYDKNNNVIASIDANNHVSRFVYDKANRQTYSVNAAGGVAFSEYDKNGNVIKRTAYQNAISLTGLGNAITASDVAARLTPSSGGDSVQRSIYDSDNRVVFSLDSLGAAVENQYDNNSNVIKRIAYNKLFSVADIDLATNREAEIRSQLTSRTDNVNDRIQRVVYDSINRTVFEIDGQGSVSEHVYDAGGNVVKRIAYANVLNTALLDGAADREANVRGQIVTSTNDRSSWAVYDSLSRGVYNIDVYGQVIESRYNKAGNVIAQTVYANAISTSLADSNPTALTDIAAALVSNAAQDRTTRTLYDSLQRQTHVIDSLGYVRESVYDHAGRVIQSIAYATAIDTSTNDTQIKTALSAIANAARDQKTRFTYDAVGRQVHAVDALGYVTANRYDALGRVLSTTQYARAITVIGNPDPAQLAVQLSPDATVDQTTGYQYDSVGRVVSTTYAQGTAIAYSVTAAYDALGQQIRVTDGNGNKQYLAYDANGRVTRQIDGLGYVVYTAYNTYGQKTAQTYFKSAVTLPVTNDDYFAYNAALINPGAAVTYTTEYNKLGQKTADVSPTISIGGIAQTIRTAYSYNTFGELTDHINAAGHADQTITHYSYDKLGRNLSKTTAFGTTEAIVEGYEYDRFGNKVQLIDPRAVEITQTDTAWALRERKRLGYTVNELGVIRAKNVIELTQTDKDNLIAGFTTQLAYDQLNRKQSETNALGYKTQYTYDAFGNTIVVTDPRGYRGYSFYDQRNQLALSISPEGQVSYSRFDNRGLVVEETRFATAVTAGITAQTTLSQALTLVVTRAGADQISRNDYDVLGRTSKATDANGYAESFVYDNQGNVRFKTSQNNHVYEFVYNARGQRIEERLPVTVDNGKGVQVQVVNQYTFDYRGNKLQTIEAAGLPEERRTRFEYNDLGQQIRIHHPQVEVYDPTPRLLTPVAVSGNANAGLITDGVVPAEGTAWQTGTSWWTDTGTVLMLDYGDNFSVSDIVISADSNDTYQIEYSTDGVDWKILTILDKNAGETVTGLETATSVHGNAEYVAGIDFDGPIVARYFRLHATAGDNMYSIGEFQAFGTSAPPAKLLTPVSVSGNTNAGLVADGVIPVEGQSWQLDTSWWTGTTTAITLDYGSEFKVSDILISADRNDTYQIDYSTDNLNWTTLTILSSSPVGTTTGMKTATSIGVNDEYLSSIDFSLPVIARYFRIHATAGDNMYSVGEFQVFGAPVPETKLLTPINVSGNPNAELVANGLVPREGTSFELNSSNWRTTDVELTLDYGSNYLVNDILISADNNDDYRIYYSTDKINWTWLTTLTANMGTIGSGLETGTSISGDPQYLSGLDFNGPVLARYFRISATWGDGYYGVGEFQAFGRPSLSAAPLPAAQAYAGYALAKPQDYFEYDVHGNLVKHTATTSDINPTAGHSTFYYYDLNNRKTTTINAVGQRTDTEYDAVGNAVVSRVYGTAVANLATLTTSDPGLMTQADVKREVIDFYDANNRKVSVVTQQVQLYTPGVGFESRAIEVKQVYDSNGNLIQSIDGNNRKTTFYYNKAGLRIAQVDALNYLTTWAYDSFGNQVKTTRYATKLNGPVDPAVLPTPVNSSEDRIQTKRYDRMNRVVESRILNVASAIVNQTSGQLTEHYADAMTVISYDGMGNVLSQTRPGDNGRADFKYDAMNRVIEEQGVSFSDYTGFTARSRTSYVYNGLGNKTQEIRHGKTALDDQVYQFIYGPGGKLKQGIDPTGATIHYTYDRFGNTTRQTEMRTDADGRRNPVVTGDYRYDALNRQTVRRGEEPGEVGTHYNLYGEIESISVNGASREYSIYNSLGQVVRSNSGDGIDKAWFYDANGNATLEVRLRVDVNATSPNLRDLTDAQIIALPNADVVKVMRIYDDHNQLIRIHQPGFETTGLDAVVLSQQYNAFGDIVAETDSRSYALTETDSAWALNARKELGYTVNEAGVIRGKYISELTQAEKTALINKYTTRVKYNALGRTIQKIMPETNVTLNNGYIDRQSPTSDFYYDLDGNVIGLRDARGKMTTQIWQGSQIAKEFFADGGQVQYLYDEFGNLRKKINQLGQTIEHDYDKNNRLIETRHPGTIRDYYEYDEAGNRIARRNAAGYRERYYYDNSNRVIKYNSYEGVTTQYRYRFDEAAGEASGFVTAEIDGLGNSLQTKKNVF